MLFSGESVRAFLRLGVLLVLLWGQFRWSSPVEAQQTESPKVPERVARYHSALMERPVRGTLFERFCDGWLESATAVELGTITPLPAAKPEALITIGTAVSRT